MFVVRIRPSRLGGTGRFGGSGVPAGPKGGKTQAFPIVYYSDRIYRNYSCDHVAQLRNTGLCHLAGSGWAPSESDMG